MGLADDRYVGFPPGSRFLLLPGEPARAARAGLALYEAVLPRQRVALVAGRHLVGSRFGRLLPPGRHDAIDWTWWERLAAEIVAPVVGHVRRVALRVPDNPRHSALFMTPEGRPVAFAKIAGPELSPLARPAWELIGGRHHEGLRVPALLAAGVLDGRPYQVTEPLPEGSHRPPPFDPGRLCRVVDVVREALSSLSAPVDTPSHHVPVHNDLTPRNLRVAADGGWWLFDLDRVAFGPRLVDEFRYWCAWFCYRRRVHIDRDAPRVLALLRERGTNEEVIEAGEWTGRPDRTYLHDEDRLRDEVVRLARIAGTSARTDEEG